MANIPLTGSGGLFTGMGLLFGGNADIIALRGGQATARVLSTASFKSRRNDIFAAYAAQSPVHNNLLTSMDSEFTQWSSAQKTFLTAMQNEAQALLIEMANDSVPLAAKTLANAMALLVTQMRGSSDSIQQVTITAGSQTAVTGVTNVGNGKVISSVKDADGSNFQYAYPETVLFGCTKDSYSGGATINQETFAVAGALKLTDTWSADWPGGSGGKSTQTCVDPTLNASGSNLLYNSDFETFNTNYPQNWTIAVGTAGTQVFQGGGSDAYTGSNCLKLTGSGGVNTSLTQLFATTPSAVDGAGGTSSVLKPRTPYGVGLWLKALSAPVAGVLTVDLIDGSGNVIADNAGTNNSFTIDLTALTTSYVFYNGVFRLPSSLPSVIKIRMRTSTAITNSSSVFIDHMSMSALTQLYTGGPYFSVTSGSVPWQFLDSFTVAISNNLGGTQPQWPGYLQRAFNMIGLGLTMPFSGSPTVASSLIT